MPSRRTEFSRRAVRWLLPATLLALAPKCLLCVFAYAGLGAALGLGGPEICGVAVGSPASWAPALAWLGVAGGFVWWVSKRPRDDGIDRRSRASTLPTSRTPASIPVARGTSAVGTVRVRDLRYR